MATTREMCVEFSKGNFSTVYPVFDEAIRWNIIGDKVITGKGEVIAFCDKMMAEMAGAQLNNTNVITNDNFVAIEGYCDYTNAEGKAAKVQYCDVYGIEQDRIKTITSYCIDSLA